VSNVFHDVPHDGNGGSGPGPLRHTHVLERSGCHWHFGHRMRGDEVLRVGSAMSAVMIVGEPAFFSCQEMTGASDVSLIP
jgi:hypothetical protein